MEELETGLSENISDATEASSEPAESLGTETTTSEGDVAKAAKPEDSVPFHEHPRWKEMLDQRNKAEETAKSLQEKYAQMEARMRELSAPKGPQAPDKRTAMIERLKGIDPDFAEFISGLAPAQTVEDVKQALATERAEQFRSAAVSTVEKLHSENKVDPALQSRYNNELELAYSRGQIKSLSDVSALYKSIHEGYSKFIDDLKRKEREGYVASKKSDGKAPTSQPKGKPATPSSTKFEYSKDPEERNAQIAKRYVDSMRASNDV